MERRQLPCDFLLARIIIQFAPSRKAVSYTHLGSGQVWDRICRIFGTPDAAFGKTDGIPEGIAYYDLSNGYDWKRLLLPDDYHLFGFWDPPYFNDDHTRFKMFKREAQEIWRVCKRLAILHPLVYPTSWFAGAGQMCIRDRHSFVNSLHLCVRVTVFAECGLEHEKRNSRIHGWAQNS